MIGKLAQAATSVQSIRVSASDRSGEVSRHQSGSRLSTPWRKAAANRKLRYSRDLEKLVPLIKPTRRRGGQRSNVLRYGWLALEARIRGR